MRTSRCVVVRSLGSFRCLRVLLPRLVLVVWGGGSHLAMAVDGGVVVAGQAAVVNSPGVTTINQVSERAVINWSNFNIGHGEAVKFNQLGVNSAVLNRVVGAGQTTIDGTLSANGRVFIVNPSGVVFGKGASVDVGALTATTLGISNEAFMQGGNNLQFISAGNTIPGFVKVEAGAQITAKSFVALLAENIVSNAGVITAGTDTAAKDRGIAMVAGTAASAIHLGGFDVTVDEQSMDALVANSGDLVIGESMSDGSILLNATGRNALMRSLLSSSGKITNNSRGVGSSTTLTSGWGLSHVGDIQAVAGKVDMRAPEIAIDGNVTVGDEKTVAPTKVNIGGAAAEHVTQGVDSVITANSQSHGQINVQAGKVLELSGELLVPTGEISLKSTILDTGLLVALAGRVDRSGVEVWARLPLRTAGDLEVYLGVDGHTYSEDGVRLAPAEPLYGAADHHFAGLASDIDQETRVGGRYYDGSPLTLFAKLHVNRRGWLITMRRASLDGRVVQEVQALLRLHEDGSLTLDPASADHVDGDISVGVARLKEGGEVEVAIDPSAVIIQSKHRFFDYVAGEFSYVVGFTTPENKTGRLFRLDVDMPELDHFFAQSLGAEVRAMDRFRADPSIVEFFPLDAHYLYAPDFLDKALGTKLHHELSPIHMTTQGQAVHRNSVTGKLVMPNGNDFPSNAKILLITPASQTTKGVIANINNGAWLVQSGVTNPIPVAVDKPSFLKEADKWGTLKNAPDTNAMMLSAFRMYDLTTHIETLVNANLIPLTQVSIRNEPIDIVFCASSKKSGTQVQVLKNQKGEALDFDKLGVLADGHVVNAYSPSDPNSTAWIVMRSDRALLDPLGLAPAGGLNVVDVSALGGGAEYLVVNNDNKVLEPSTMEISKSQNHLTEAIGLDGTKHKFLSTPMQELVKLTAKSPPGRIINIDEQTAYGNTPIMVVSDPKVRP